MRGDGGGGERSAPKGSGRAYAGGGDRRNEGREREQRGAGGRRQAREARGDGLACGGLVRRFGVGVGG